MAAAIGATLDAPPSRETLRQRAALFALATSVNQYVRVLDPTAPNVEQG
jgi:hypothetical protein